MRSSSLSKPAVARTELLRPTLARPSAATLAIVALLVFGCGSPGNTGPFRLPLPAPVVGSSSGGPPQLAPVTCPAYDASTILRPLPLASSTSEAGSITGSFSVTASGQATYTMPLTVPPGVLSMEPHLSVAYDSSGG
jgi:hypothetical protein